MKLPKLAIDNYQFTLIAFILVTIAGVTSYLQMPRTENPEILVPGASVVVIFPGASPVDLEQLVADPIEESINELEDIKKINTSIKDGISITSVEFDFGTNAQDKYDEVVQQINSLKNELPDDIFSLTTKQWSTSDVAMMQIALVSEDAEFRELEEKAERLKSDIDKISGVRRVEIVALPGQEVRVSLDMEKMAHMNIGLDQISNAIKSNNANIPGGSIDLADKSFGIKTSGSYNNIEEIRNTVVNSFQGRLIYLKHIAEIDYDYEDYNYYARFGKREAPGQKIEPVRCIFVTVTQKEGLNIFKTTNRIRPVIESFKNELEENISLNYVFDQSIGVDQRINKFLKNLLQGIILVGLVILLALGFKSSIIVIVAIPLSIIMGLYFVDLADFGMQQISIAGLVVALGLLVDNSIVMVENINRYIALGHRPRDAAINAASEIGWPIVSATATTVLAFIPIVMMPDKSGVFIRSLPVTIIATLIVSLIIALSLTPLIASKVFKSVDQDAKIAGEKTRGFKKYLMSFIEGPYRKLLNLALNNRWITLSFALVILLVSIYSFRFVGVSFFPKDEKPQFVIQVNTSENSNLDKTDKTTRYIESVLDTLTEVKFYASNVGHGNPRIYYNTFARNLTKNFAEIFVQLYNNDIDDVDKIINNLRSVFDIYPEAEINVKEYEQGPPVNAPVEVFIIGNDIDKLALISKDIEKIIREQEGAINVENELSKTRTELFFNINKDKASMLGVPVFEIDKTIRTAISGAAVSKYRDKEGNEYNIVLRLPVDEKLKIEDFEKIYVRSLSGKSIPLKQLATLEFKRAPTKITHFNLNRTATILADVKKGHNLDEIMEPVIDELEMYPFPGGFGFHIGGELESRNETFGGMQVAIIIALIAIFAVLVLQFKSFVQPLIIYIAIPFAAIGMIWALLLSGNTFSFTAFVGLISLVGIVINNSIILVDYTNKLRAQGKPIVDALKTAGEVRFTPIILTTLTTIGGILPLTLGGGTMWEPMGWTLIGGLAVSTMLTLIVVPVLYRILVRRPVATS